MVTRLVQNTCIHNRRKTIHNYLKDVPNKKKNHPTINSNSIMPAITKDNNILELQGLLEHNDLLAKLQSKLNKCYLSNKHN
jgi:hypothetical protein